MTVTDPTGFRAAGVPAGLKASGALDLALIVNDGPSDVASAGAISYGVLWAYERIRSRPCVAEP